MGLQTCGRGGDRPRRLSPARPGRTRNTRIGRCEILDALLAKILKRHAEPVPGLITDRARDADAAGLGVPCRRAATFTPSPKMSWSSLITSPRLMPMRKWISRPGAASPSRPAMRRWIPTAHATASAMLEELLDQHVVPGGLDQPAPVLGDRRIDQLQTMGLEARERARLIAFHQAAVADHVGGKDGREPAFDCGLVHERDLSSGPGRDYKPPGTRPALPACGCDLLSTTRGASRHDALPGDAILVPPAGLEPARPCGQQILSSMRPDFPNPLMRTMEKAYGALNR